MNKAERTRQVLSSVKPQVKFRKDYEAPEIDRFEYTSGVKDGGVDVWLITGVLTLLVPLIVFVVGVKAGVIDLNPR